MIVISIVAMNCDIPKYSLLFSMKREMNVIIFFVNFESAVLFLVKRDLPSTTLLVDLD